MWKLLRSFYVVRTLSQPRYSFVCLCILTDVNKMLKHVAVDVYLHVFVLSSVLIRAEVDLQMEVIILYHCVFEPHLSFYEQ